MRHPGGLLGLIALGLACGAGPAWAQADLFTADTVHGLVDFRLAGAEGEKSFLDDQGFGKTAVSGAGGDEFDVEPLLSQAVLEWKPKFSFAFGGVVSGQLQPQVSPALDLDEVYLTYRAPPNSLGRFEARAGLFFPPVSLEHDGPGWTTTETLSASAINTWIGEEVKVLGMEASVQRAFGDHEVEATAAVFGWNDTSGTLLSFRGWALHGLRTGVSTDFDLPPLSAFMRTKQAAETDPFFKLDDRAGYYGRLVWRPPAAFSLEAIYYDNAGNRIAVKDLQWAWETRFFNLGLRWEVDDKTKVLAQAMNGETLMGYRMRGGIWVDMGFRAAYVLAARQVGEGAVSGRVDWFETNDRTFTDIDNNDETGWALTGAWRRPLAEYADFWVEALHVSSKRPSRSLGGLAPKQGQTVLQAALRLNF